MLRYPRHFLRGLSLDSLEATPNFGESADLKLWPDKPSRAPNEEAGPPPFSGHSIKGTCVPVPFPVRPCKGGQRSPTLGATCEKSIGTLLVAQGITPGSPVRIGAVRKISKMVSIRHSPTSEDWRYMPRKSVHV